MALSDLQCPICDADIPLGGDERSGDEIFCTVCGAPCTISGKPGEGDCEAEADF